MERRFALLSMQNVCTVDLGSGHDHRNGCDRRVAEIACRGGTATETTRMKSSAMFSRNGKRIVFATVLLATAVAITPIAAASAAPTTGSAGSSEAAPLPMVGEAFVANELKWQFDADPAGHVVEVRVDPDDSNDTLRHCVNDRTGGFSFTATVGATGATRADNLWMKASQSIFDGCFVNNSTQTWRVTYTSSRSASQLSKSEFFIQFHWVRGDLQVSYGSSSGDAIPIALEGSTIAVRPTR